MDRGTYREEPSNRNRGQPGAAADAKRVATQSDPSKSNPGSARLPGVSLPKSGGAIKGLGEKFSVGAATGTASLAVPLALSPARLTPHLQLAYDSGSGNGPFGFGLCSTCRRSRARPTRDCRSIATVTSPTFYPFRLRGSGTDSRHERRAPDP